MAVLLAPRREGGARVLMFDAIHRHSGPQGSIEPFTIVDDPSAWLAEDYRGREESFIYHFTEQYLKEIHAAVAKVEAKGLRIEGWPIAFTEPTTSLLSRHITALYPAVVW